jgi:hypothetical protein
MTSNEEERKYLRDRITPGTPHGSLADLWKQLLDQELVSAGSLQERQDEYLAGEGYTGVFSEKWIDFKADLPIAV